MNTTNTTTKIIRIRNEIENILLETTYWSKRPAERIKLKDLVENNLRENNFEFFDKKDFWFKVYDVFLRKPRFYNFEEAFVFLAENDRYLKELIEFFKDYDEFLYKELKKIENEIGDIDILDETIVDELGEDFIYNLACWLLAKKLLDEFKDIEDDIYYIISKYFEVV